MSYFRIYEDQGMNIDAKKNRNISSTINYIKPNLYVCNYCNDFFYNKEELFSHIKDHHKLDAILMVDNKVKTNDRVIYLSELNSAYIYIYNKDISIFIDQEKLAINERDKIDIMTLLNFKLQSSGKCILRIGKKTITINKHSIDLINENIINSIIDRWSKDCESKKSISENYISDLNDSEVRFLDGCYNYFLACKANAVDKINRYNDAYEILSEFYNLNSIGLTILKIIFFRRNWFLKLEQICSNSNVVDDFDIILSVINKKNFPYDDFIQKEIGQLYIEDELKYNIEAFINYSKGKLDLVVDYLRFCEDNEKIDANLNERILFLKGLVEYNRGKIKRVKSILKELNNEILKEKLMQILESNNE